MYSGHFQGVKSYYTVRNNVGIERNNSFRKLKLKYESIEFISTMYRRIVGSETRKLISISMNIHPGNKNS